MPNQVSNDFKKGTASFKLVGKIRVTPNTFTMNKESESKFVSNKMYFGVDCGNGNVVYAEMFGGYKKDDDGNAISEIYVNGNKADPNNPNRMIDDYDNRFTIGWDERNIKGVLENIGPSCFTQVGFEKDTQGQLVNYKFVTPYDAITYFYNTWQDMSAEDKEACVVEVRGNLEYRYRNGKVYYHKVITGIKRKFDVVEKDFVAEFTQTVFADKDSIGKADMEKMVLPLSVKVPEYISKWQNIEIKETVPLDIELQLDAKASIAKWLANNIKNSKGYVRTTLIGNFIESGATEEFDLSSLDEKTRGMLEQGAISLDDIKMVVASGNQRTQIMSVNRIKVRKEDNRPVGDFDQNVYTEKEMESFGDKFFTVVREFSENSTADTNTAVSEPTNDDADELPYDVQETTPMNDMDWMKTFQ